MNKQDTERDQGDWDQMWVPEFTYVALLLTAVLFGGMVLVTGWQPRYHLSLVGALAACALVGGVLVGGAESHERQRSSRATGIAVVRVAFPVALIVDVMLISIWPDETLANFVVPFVLYFANIAGLVMGFARGHA